MANLKSRIIAIENKTILKHEIEIVPLLTEAWKRDGKTYYRGRDDTEKEFIESEHRERPIFRYYKNEEGCTPITNL